MILSAKIPLMMKTPLMDPSFLMLHVAKVVRLFFRRSKIRLFMHLLKVFPRSLSSKALYPLGHHIDTLIVNFIVSLYGIFLKIDFFQKYPIPSTILAVQKAIAPKFVRIVCFWPSFMVCEVI